jgi:hypothetical protein
MKEDSLTIHNPSFIPTIKHLSKMIVGDCPDRSFVFEMIIA